MKIQILSIIMFATVITVALPCHAIDRKTLIQYASALKGLKKADLKTAIYNNCQPNKVLAYGAGTGSTWSGFVKTDIIGNTLECRNRYSTDRFYFSSTTSTNAISGMNIEHSFPKSWWGGTKNNAYQDLFNLYPSSSSDNGAKSNYPMGKVTNPSILDDYEKVGKGAAGSHGTIVLCEPNDLWKGDFCRSYFYMATIYQNLTWSGTQGLQELEQDTWPTLQEWAYTLYLDWTRTDTVSSVEVDRNNAVYAIQGNRNLFIDFPYLSEYIWGDSINATFDPTTSITTASDDNRYAESIVIPEGDDDPQVNPGTEDNPDVDPESDYYFAETFTGCDSIGGTDGMWSGTVANGILNASSTDNADWTFVKGFEGNQCLKLGTSKAAGSATTPQIIGLAGKEFILTFDAGAWAGDKTTIIVKGENCTLSDSLFNITNSEFNTYTIKVTNVTGNVKFTFKSVTSSKNRFFLDNILIPKEAIFEPDKEYIADNI